MRAHEVLLGSSSLLISSLDRLEHGKLLEVNSYARYFIKRDLSDYNFGCFRPRISPAAQTAADEIPPEIQSSLASPETLDIYSVTSEGVLEKLR